MASCLRPFDQYTDQYDRHTVERCRNLERLLKERGTRSDEHATVLDLILYMETGERWAAKESTIAAWMERDRALDRLLAEAAPPQDVQCLVCRAVCRPDGPVLTNNRPLFHFFCPEGHAPARAFFDTGEEYRVPTRICPRCARPLSISRAREGSVVRTVERCTACNREERHELDLAENIEPEPPDPHFAIDRERFCISDEAGQEYLRVRASLQQLEAWSTAAANREEAEDRATRIAALKRLTIFELETFLTTELASRQFVRFALGSPEMGREVIVPFSLQDARPGRTAEDSAADLTEQITKLLADTTWRLVHDSVSYRLGLLTGRLRAYEQEEDVERMLRDSANDEGLGPLPR